MVRVAALGDLHCAKTSQGAFQPLFAKAAEAADILLNQANVSTVPGIVFGPDGESHLRFSFSTSIETIEAGLDSLRRRL